MRKAGLIGVVLVVLSAILLQPARAQGSWECRFDFTDNNGGWTSVIGSYSAGHGWITAGSTASRAARIQKTFASSSITSIEMVWEWDGSPRRDNGWIKYGSVNDTFDGSSPRTKTETATATSADLAIGNGNLISDAVVNGTITEVTITGTGSNPFTTECAGEEEPPPTGELTRPLASAEEHPIWGMYDFTYLNSLNGAYSLGDTVHAFSEEAGASVSAVAPGTVTAVIPFTADLCFTPVTVFSNLFLCAEAVAGAITEESFNLIFSLEMIGNYMVVVEDAVDATIQYSYILNKPTVTVGDEVVAGCVIGQTIRLKTMPFPDFEVGILGIGISGGLSFVSPPTSAGVVYVTMYEDNEEAQLYPSLALEPDQADCAVEVLAACINANPELFSMNYYIADPDITMLEEGRGVNIPRFTYMIQNNIMVDPEEEYTLNVQARMRSAGGDDDFVTMNLGVTSQIETYTVTPDWRNYTLTTTGDDWHQGNFVSVQVSNQQSSAGSLEVRYICLSPVTASTAPGSCYFANHEFDQDGTGWTFDTTTFNTGQAIMRDGDTLTQGVLLKPDDESTSHTYTIRAVGRLLASSLYTGQVGKSATLNFQYPVSEGMEEVGTIDSARVLAEGLNPVSGAVQIDYAYTLETTIEIEEDTSSAFTFEVDVTDGDNYIQGIRLDSVCIDPAGDGSYPGQDGGAGYEPPFIPGCTVVPVPLDGSVAAWTFYHWSQLKRFFSCELMKLLNNWFKQFESLRRVILGIARWWIALVHHVSRWLTSVFFWLNGQFQNMVNGQVTTIVDSGGCHDLFCAIVDVVSTLGNLLNPVVQALNNVVNVLLGIVVGTVNLFFAIIGGLVGFVVALIIKLFTLFQLAGALLTTIITAYNSASPTAIPGLPMCATDFNSSPLCTMVWVTDNTIFSGRWGVIWVLVLSILTIHLILWAIRELKETLLKTWGSS